MYRPVETFDRSSTDTSTKLIHIHIYVYICIYIEKKKREISGKVQVVSQRTSYL